MRSFTWRAWMLRLDRLWRSSLQLRTVAISVVMSAIAVGIIGAYMSFSIGDNLFDSRLELALSASERSNAAAQSRFDAVQQQTSGLDLDRVMDTAADAALASSSTSAGTSIAILRTPGQAGARLPVDKLSAGLDPEAVISPGLRTDVEDSDERRLFWQSVSLPQDGGGADPALVVGSVLDVPSSGQYEMYLVYNLSACWGRSPTRWCG
jgi:two-component system sensor histidine kinase MtrB